MKDNNSSDKGQGITYAIKDGEVIMRHDNGYTMTYHTGDNGIEVSYQGNMPNIPHASDN